MQLLQGSRGEHEHGVWETNEQGAFTESKRDELDMKLCGRRCSGERKVGKLCKCVECSES